MKYRTNTLKCIICVALHRNVLILMHQRKEGETREEVNETRERREQVKYGLIWCLCGEFFFFLQSLWLCPFAVYGPNRTSFNPWIMSRNLEPLWPHDTWKAFPYAKHWCFHQNHAVLLIISQLNPFLWGVSVLLGCSPPGRNTAKVILTCCFNSPIGCHTVLTSIALVNSPKWLD